MSTAPIHIPDPPARANARGPALEGLAEALRPDVVSAILTMTDPVELIDRLQAQPGELVRFKLMWDPWVLLRGKRGVEFFFRLDEHDVDALGFRVRMPTLHLPGARTPADVTATTRLSRRFIGQVLGQMGPGGVVDTLARALPDWIRAYMPAQEGTVDDLFAVLLRLCIRASSLVLLGERAAARLPAGYEDVYAKVEDAISMRAVLFPSLPLPGAHRAEATVAAAREVSAMLARLIEERRAAPAEDAPPDLLQMYLDARREDGSPFSLATEEIVWLVNALHWAAHHYPAMHAFSAFTELLSHPEALRRAALEARAPERLDAAAVASMRYLDACLRESLRLHALMFVPHRVLRPLTFGDQRIEPGAVVTISPYAEHRNPEVFPAPEEFRPERWLDPARPIPHHAFVPGSGGFSGCVGMHLTLQMLTTMWATLLRELDLTLLTPPPEANHRLLLLPPEQPTPARYRRRIADARPAKVDYDAIYRSQPAEFAGPVTSIEGQIPTDLDGTLLRNGPAVFEAGADVLHFLDGHGMVCGLDFRDGKAFFRSKLVDTEVLRRERAAGRQILRRTFTNLPSPRDNVLNVKLGNPASHDAVAWAGKVFATSELGYYALDPRTLQTIAEERWSGVAGAGALLSPHLRYDPYTDSVLGFTITPNPVGKNRLRFVLFDRSFRPRERVDTFMSHPGAGIHDFALTEHYFLAIEQPLRVSLPKLLAGQHTPFEATEWLGGGSVRVIIASRAGRSGRGTRVEVNIDLPGVHSSSHIVNAFERDGRVVIDLLGSPEVPEVTPLLPPASPERRKKAPRPGAGNHWQRFLVDPITGEAQRVPVPAIECEHPTLNPAYRGKPYRYAYWMTPEYDGREPYKGIIFWYHGVSRVDVETGEARTWSFGGDTFCSQPMFAPRTSRASEDDGYVLTWLLDGRTSLTKVAILDARAIERGPIAVVNLGHRLPATVHGQFADGVHLDWA